METCGARAYIGADYGGAEFACERPDGHAAPHRQRSAGSLGYPDAEVYEWWPQTWWDTGTDAPLATEATRCTDERDHDWRVDPFAALLSNPPAERLVCARCYATTTRHRATTPAQPGRPQTWPKA